MRFQSQRAPLSLRFAFVWEAQRTWKENDLRNESYNFKQSSFTDKDY